MLDYIRTKRDEEGFTLIELLVVVIIIGILAAIAIPVFLNQRQNAWRSAAESDARNAAIEVESFFTNTGAYPANDGAFQGIADLPSSTGVTLVYVRAADENSYTISARHTNIGTGTELVAFYDSANGGILRVVDGAVVGAPEDEDG